jgi:hypothetical protein
MKRNFSRPKWIPGGAPRLPRYQYMLVNVPLPNDVRIIWEKYSRLVDEYKKTQDSRLLTEIQELQEKLAEHPKYFNTSSGEAALNPDIQQRLNYLNELIDNYNNRNDASKDQQYNDEINRVAAELGVEVTQTNVETPSQTVTSSQTAATAQPSSNYKADAQTQFVPPVYSPDFVGPVQPQQNTSYDKIYKEINLARTSIIMSSLSESEKVNALRDLQNQETYIKGLENAGYTPNETMVKVEGYKPPDFVGPAPAVQVPGYSFTVPTNFQKVVKGLQDETPLSFTQKIIESGKGYLLNMDFFGLGKTAYNLWGTLLGRGEQQGNSLFGLADDYVSGAQQYAPYKSDPKKIFISPLFTTAYTFPVGMGLGAGISTLSAVSKTAGTAAKVGLYSYGAFEGGKAATKVIQTGDAASGFNLLGQSLVGMSLFGLGYKKGSSLIAERTKFNIEMNQPGGYIKGQKYLEIGKTDSYNIPLSRTRYIYNNSKSGIAGGTDLTTYQQLPTNLPALPGGVATKPGGFVIFTPTRPTSPTTRVSGGVTYQPPSKPSTVLTPSSGKYPGAPGIKFTNLKQTTSNGITYWKSTKTSGPLTPSTGKYPGPSSINFDKLTKATGPAGEYLKPISPSKPLTPSSGKYPGPSSIEFDNLKKEIGPGGIDVWKPIKPGKVLTPSTNEGKVPGINFDNLTPAKTKTGFDYLKPKTPSKVLTPSTKSTIENIPEKTSIGTDVYKPKIKEGPLTTSTGWRIQKGVFGEYTDLSKGRPYTDWSGPEYDKWLTIAQTRKITVYKKRDGRLAIWEPPLDFFAKLATNKYISYPRTRKGKGRYITFKDLVDAGVISEPKGRTVTMGRYQQVVLEKPVTKTTKVIKQKTQTLATTKTQSIQEVKKGYISEQKFDMRTAVEKMSPFKPIYAKKVKKRIGVISLSVPALKYYQTQLQEPSKIRKSVVDFDTRNIYATINKQSLKSRSRTYSYSTYKIKKDKYIYKIENPIDKQKDKLDIGYDVYVNGKQLTKTPQTYKSALGLGARFTDKTMATEFKLKKRQAQYVSRAYEREWAARSHKFKKTDATGNITFKEKLRYREDLGKL